jgi:hypothetical protein
MTAMAREAATAAQAAASLFNNTSRLDAIGLNERLQQVGRQVTIRRNPHRRHPSGLDAIAATMPLGSVSILYSIGRAAGQAPQSEVATDRVQSRDIILARSNSGNEILRPETSSAPCRK